MNRTTHESQAAKLYEAFLGAWNRGSSSDLASIFTADGDLVGFDGNHLNGREQIREHHKPLFERWLKGSRLVGQVKDVRYLTPDVAVMHAVGGTVMKGRDAPTRVRDSIQTLVAVRYQTDWQLAAFHNTRLRPLTGGRALIAWTLSDWLWRLFGLISTAPPYDDSAARRTRIARARSKKPGP